MAVNEFYFEGDDLLTDKFTRSQQKDFLKQNNLKFYILSISPSLSKVNACFYHHVNSTIKVTWWVTLQFTKRWCNLLCNDLDTIWLVIFVYFSMSCDRHLRSDCPSIYYSKVEFFIWNHLSSRNICIHQHHTFRL